MPTLQQLCGAHEADQSSMVNGDLWLIHTGNQVEALALRTDMHKRILADPAEVWVGSQPKIARWGDLFPALVKVQRQLPVYLKTPMSRAYQFEGMFRVIHETTAAAELALRRRRFGASMPLSRIIFLARVS
jgi:hypothetical protein